MVEQSHMQEHQSTYMQKKEGSRIQSQKDVKNEDNERKTIDDAMERKRVKLE